MASRQGDEDAVLEDANRSIGNRTKMIGSSYCLLNKEKNP